MRVATLLSAVGYAWCAMAGIFVGYTAAVSLTPLNPWASFGFLCLLMIPGLTAITVGYLKSRST